MDLKQAIQDKPPQEVAAADETFLQSFVTPAFGALPKSEIELLVLTLLEKLGAISSDPEVYELVSKLRVTRTKARSLIYERELRRLSPGELDNRVREMLKRPLIQKQGELFVLEVENPLVSDHLRSKVQKLGYISDGSFSPSIVKLPLDAIVALIDLYVVQGKEQVRNALVAAGAPDTSFKGVLKSVLKKVASRVASESGEALLDKASEYIGPILDAVTEGLTGKIAEIFPQDAQQEG
jgi:hypothetical protein